MENVEIRRVRNREELEEAFDLWTCVFPEDRSFFQKRVDLYPYCDKETTWIAKVNGEIGSAVHIFPYYIRMENVVLKVGGIAYVATLPDFRGRGLAQTILKRQSDWMKRHGYDLSMLFTPINPYYEKIGWETVSRQSQCLQELKWPELDEEKPYSVAAFTQNDLEEVQKIHNDFNRDYLGPRIRTADYWKSQLQWDQPESSDFLVAKKNGMAAGYIKVQGGDNEELNIDECCYLQGEEEAVVALLKEITDRKVFKTLKASVPHSHFLYSFFEERGAKEESITSDMWKILSFKRLLEKLRPVFTERLRRANWNNSQTFRVLMQCGRSEAILLFCEGIAGIEEPTEALYYQHLFKLKDNEFIQLLLKGARKDQDQVMSGLFPSRSYQIWETDAF